MFTYETPVVFYRMPSNGREPAREFIAALPPDARRAVKKAVRILQQRWPATGMPRVRKMERDLWELRCRIAGGYVRVFFTFAEGALVLLHGFVKKSDDTPPPDLAVARRRMKDVQE